MKKHVVSLSLILVTSFIVFSAPKISMEELKEKREAFLKLSPEERAKVIAARKEKTEKRFGGYVRNTTKQHGRVLIANSQSQVSIDAVRKSISKLASKLQIAIDVENIPSSSVNVIG
jgi:hypothetical protein